VASPLLHVQELAFEYALRFRLDSSIDEAEHASPWSRPSRVNACAHSPGRAHPCKTAHELLYLRSILAHRCGMVTVTVIPRCSHERHYPSETVSYLLFAQALSGEHAKAWVLGS
jgi:hypothetical protein